MSVRICELHEPAQSKCQQSKFVINCIYFVTSFIIKNGDGESSDFLDVILHFMWKIFM